MTNLQHISRSMLYRRVLNRHQVRHTMRTKSLKALQKSLCIFANNFKLVFKSATRWLKSSRGWNKRFRNYKCCSRITPKWRNKFLRHIISSNNSSGDKELQKMVDKVPCNQVSRSNNRDQLRNSNSSLLYPVSNRTKLKIILSSAFSSNLPLILMEPQSLTNTEEPTLVELLLFSKLINNNL